MRFLLLLAFILATGCSSVVYKMDIAQGNLVDQKMVDRLKPGMSKRQVEVVMGTPLIASPFDQSQWNYLTATSHRGHKHDIKNLSLFFDGDTLSRIEGDWQPQDEDSLLAQSQALRPNGQREKIPAKAGPDDDLSQMTPKERRAFEKRQRKLAKAQAKEAKRARKEEKSHEADKADQAKPAGDATEGQAPASDDDATESDGN